MKRFNLPHHGDGFSREKSQIEAKKRDLKQLQTQLETLQTNYKYQSEVLCNPEAAGSIAREIAIKNREIQQMGTEITQYMLAYEHEVRWVNNCRESLEQAKKRVVDRLAEIESSQREIMAFYF